MRPDGRFLAMGILALVLGSVGAAVALNFTPHPSLDLLPPPHSETHWNIDYHTESPYKEYLASYKADGVGDNVVFRAWLNDPHKLSLAPSAYWYTIDMSGTRQNGAGGTPDYESHCANEKDPRSTAGLLLSFMDRMDFDPCTFTILGSQEGVLTATLHVKVALSTYDSAASGQALVKRGDGDVILHDGHALYEEGQVVNFDIRTGSCGLRTSSCFSLHIIDPHSKDVSVLPVLEHAGDTNYGRSSWQRVAWTVPAGAFVACTGSADSLSNVWHYELRNDLIAFHVGDIFVVDKAVNAPPAPTLALHPAKLVAGSPATVEIHASTNSNGATSLKAAAAWIWYGPNNEQPGPKDDSWILQDSVLPLARDASPLMISKIPNDPNGCSYDFTSDRVVNCNAPPTSPRSHPVVSYSSSIQFTPGKEGEVQVRVVAIDADCRPSEPSTVSALTEHGKPAPLNHPTTSSADGIVIVALVIAGAGIGAVLLWVRNPVHKWTLAIGIVVAVVLFVGIVLWTASGGLS